jgi:hypothetical protein
MHALDDRSGDPQRSVPAPAEAAARGFDYENAGFVLEEPPYRVLTQAPLRCHLRRRIMKLHPYCLSWYFNFL